MSKSLGFYVLVVFQKIDVITGQKGHAICSSFSKRLINLDLCSFAEVPEMKQFVSS